MIAAARTRYEKRLPRSIRRRMPRSVGKHPSLVQNFFRSGTSKELYVLVQFFHRLLRSVQKTHTTNRYRHRMEPVRSVQVPTRVCLTANIACRSSNFLTAPRTHKSKSPSSCVFYITPFNKPQGTQSVELRSTSQRNNRNVLWIGTNSIQKYPQTLNPSGFLGAEPLNSARKREGS